MKGSVRSMGLAMNGNCSSAACRGLLDVSYHSGVALLMLLRRYSPLR